MFIEPQYLSYILVQMVYGVGGPWLVSKVDSKSSN